MNHKQLLQGFQKASLRPTATVVRGRDGKIKVERSELLSKSETQERVATSVAAGKLRKGLPQHLLDSQDQEHFQFPIESGLVYEFNDKVGENGWQRLDESSDASDRIRDEPVLPLSIRVVTFNVWFSEYEWQHRLDGLMALIENEQPQVVCLQEVTSRFLTRLMTEYPISRQRFRLVSSVLKKSWFGLAMLVHKDLPLASVEIVSLPTKMGRSALVASFHDAAKKTTLAIATVHLESLKSRLIRNEQLQKIHQTLSRYDAALLVGDYNILRTGPWADEQEDDDLLTNNLENFDDLWLQSGSDDFIGATFDTSHNTMLAQRCHFKESARYDRACLYSASRSDGLVGWDCPRIEIVGREPVQKLGANGNPIFISDHFGLSLDLVQKTTSTGEDEH